MKFKYLFLSLMLLMVVGSIAAVGAADDYESLGDYTFDIPDGYQVVDKDSDMLAMEADEDHNIIVYKLDDISDFDLFKSLLEEAGCEFADEESFQSGSFDVTQYSYSYMDAQGYLYVCDDGGTPIIVAGGMPAGEDAPAADDNPARQVVDSLE